MKMFTVKFNCVVDNNLFVLIAQFICLIDCVHSLKEVFFHFFDSDFHTVWDKYCLIDQILFLRVKYLSKSVSFTVNLIWLKDHLKVELRQNIKVSDLLMYQLLIFYKDLQYLMISKDLYKQISVFQFQTSVFKAADNDQKLFIINIIIALHRYYALVVEDHWMKNIFIIVLRENLTDN